LRAVRRIAPLALLLLLPAASPAQQRAQPQLEFHFAYRPAAFEALREHIDQVTIVSPEPFIVDSAGSVTGELEPRVLELAKAHGVRVMPQIKNLDKKAGLFSRSVAHSVLNDPAIRKRVIDSMVEICRRYDLYGMQVDIEAIHVEDRDALTRFYREAADALHRDGRAISIAVVHRAEESPGPTTYTQWMMEDWRGAFDLKALGEIGDFVKIMSYGQHTRRTPPGPSQGLPWLEDVVQYFLRYVPPEKLSLGITMGGARWHAVSDPTNFPRLLGGTTSSGITPQEARALVERHGAAPLQWDDRQKVLIGYVENGGVFEWLVLDNDPRSLDAKLDLVRKYRLRAINMWVNGREDAALWERVRGFRVE
jgi:spore germination protein YaaH